MSAIDQGRIDAYAEVSGDHNPLHVDPAFAAGTAFGTTIVHGHLLIGLIGREAEIRYGDEWVRSGWLETKFVAPVSVGEDPEVRWGDDGTVTVCVGECVCVVGTARVGRDG